MTVSNIVETLRRSAQRFAIALSFAAAFAVVGTYVLLKVDARPEVVLALVGLLWLAVMMQTLSPGTGLHRFRPRQVQRPARTEPTGAQRTSAQPAGEQARSEDVGVTAEHDQDSAVAESS